jgi:propanol-preferring alcohol dehydrogenase
VKAAVLVRPKRPLEVRDLPVPVPAAGQLLIRVAACGVCRTDLHIVDGELVSPKLPLVPGHEIVGRIEATGGRGSKYLIGERVGVPWLGSTCGACYYCRKGAENLCDRPQFTGYTLDGGFAEYAVADERFCFPIPDGFSDLEAAPLLCAGLIGYRALTFAGNVRYLGIYGFGAAAHIITQVAVHQGRIIYAFTKKGDEEGRKFARSLGANWAGTSSDGPPHSLDAAIIFAPVGALVPVALRALVRGGIVVCAGIHMSDIPSFPYGILWGERAVRSVANLTRRDGEEFLTLAAEVPVRTKVKRYALDEVNSALEDLRSGNLTGAAVITP